MDIPASALVPIVALLISTATLLFAVYSIRQRAKNDYVEILNTMVTRCEHELELCKIENKRLLAENIDLLRRVIQKRPSI